MNNLTGIIILPATRSMNIKKRYRAVKIGLDFYVHKKTYKKLRKTKNLEKLLSKIKVNINLPKLDIFNNYFEIDNNIDTYYGKLR